MAVAIVSKADRLPCVRGLFRSPAVCMLGISVLAQLIFTALYVTSLHGTSAIQQLIQANQNRITAKNIDDVKYFDAHNNEWTAPVVVQHRLDSAAELSQLNIKQRGLEANLLAVSRSSQADTRLFWWLMQFAMFPFIAFIVWRIVLARRQERRRMKHLCMMCGYNLTGNLSGLCPECGSAIPDANPGTMPLSL
jgi:hypothetical protein